MSSTNDHGQDHDRQRRSTDTVLIARVTAETIARLRISLDDIRPEIWRVVEIQTSASLKAVHDVIQAAMGWQDYHLWDFEAGGRR